MNINYLLEVLDYIHYSLVIIVTDFQGPKGIIASTLIQATWMIDFRRACKGGKSFQRFIPEINATLDSKTNFPGVPGAP